MKTIHLLPIIIGAIILLTLDSCSSGFNAVKHRRIHKIPFSSANVRDRSNEKKLVAINENTKSNTSSKTQIRPVSGESIDYCVELSASIETRGEESLTKEIEQFRAGTNQLQIRHSSPQEGQSSDSSEKIGSDTNAKKWRKASSITALVALPTFLIMFFGWFFLTVPLFILWLAFLMFLISKILQWRYDKSSSQQLSPKKISRRTFWFVLGSLVIGFFSLVLALTPFILETV